MTPERSRQIEELWHSAREREPGQRAAFLAEACQGDEGLRREVESLLASEGGAPEPLQSEHPLTPGVELGPYVIETRLGAGGMGGCIAPETSVCAARLP